jgi:immune inhibitor A
MSYLTRRFLSIFLLAAVLLSLIALPATQSAPLAAEAMPPHPRLDEMIQSGKLQTPQMVDQIDESALRMEGMAAVSETSLSTVKALAVLVDFSDKVHTVQASYFGSLIFAPPVAGRGSVNDYFNEVSYGQVDIITLNLPSDQPNSALGELGWQRAPQTHAYYTNNKYCTDGTYPNNCRKLAEDVVDAINDVVDFSQYDNDHNGYMEPIMLVHAGSGAEYTGSTADIWSHSWYLYNYRNYDGVTINRYVIMPEYWGATPTANMTIGVFAHEMGHGFWNLPDLYDRDGSSEGIGKWSLMASGSWNGTNGNSPAWPDAWSRLKMGYSTATTLASDITGQSILQVGAGSTGTIFKLKNGVLAAQEYFLVENRQKTAGTYDEYLPGAGLAIWHVDEAKAGNQNDQECRSEPNSVCGSTHYEVALEQADGVLDLEYRRDRGDSGDVFPGSTANRIWSNATDPESGSWYSATPTNIGVVNISDSAAAMTADLLISSGPPPPAISISDVSVTEGDSGTTPATFNINLSAAAAGPVSVNWATANGTATAGTDYGAGSGTASFAAGESVKTVAVLVIGDTAAEPDETFYVNLSNPVGGTLADGQGVGTIANDDPPAAPTNLTLTPVSSTQINLAWTDNANTESGYYVERSVSGGSWAEIATLTANANSYANTGLAGGTTYGYRVRAYNTWGDSPYSNEPAATTPIQPTIHIGDLDGARSVLKKSWTASVTVAVHDASHKLMSGVVVTGDWSVGGTGSCTTSRKGVCTIKKSGIPFDTSSVTFTVDGASLAGYGYDSGANHDVDGGSDGTTITIMK